MQIIVTKFYGHFVRDKIEGALTDWIKVNIKGEYRIIETGIQTSTMTRSVTFQFEDKADALKMSSMNIPVDLYREKWRKKRIQLTKNQ
jgi:hypothetical protein